MRPSAATTMQTTLTPRALFALSLVALGACSGSSDTAATDGGPSLVDAAADSPSPVVCIPGAQLACACPGGAQGVQVCSVAGTGLGVCDCPDARAPQDAPSLDATVVDASVDAPIVDRVEVDAPVDVTVPDAVDAPGIDAPAPDVGFPDAGSPADACGPCIAGPNVASATCLAGRCVTTCATGFADCNGTSADGCETALDSATSCGACGVACSVPSGGRATCDGASCGIACDSGFHACGARCASNTAAASCGTRCDACPLPTFAATATCAAGACGFTCSSGYHACGSSCVDDSRVATCGSRCTPCPSPANGAATCVARACSFTCDPGYMASVADCVLAPPRPTSPLSAARVYTSRPTLRWRPTTVATGARVEICRDRACATIEHSFDATGSFGVPGVSLSAGVHFWRLYTRTSAGLGERASPTWEFVVTPRPTPVDTTWGTLADFNGDGLGDVIIPVSPTSDRGGVGEVYLGRRGGLAATPSQQFTVPSDVTPRTVADDLAVAADVNGDGFPDLVGARAGSVILLYGGPTGLPSSPSLTIPPPEAGRNFAVSVDGAGDVNGDGYGDVLAGATAGDGGGRVYAFFGGPNGLSATPGFVLRPPVRLGRGASFGVQVAGVGDTDGDGYADAAVSAIDNTRATVCVFSGSSSGFTVSICEDEVSPGGGFFVDDLEGAGDFNGDGLADMVFGESSVLPVRVVFGGSRGVFAIGRPSGDAGAFGDGIEAAGDVDGDGFDDLAVGSYRAGSEASVYGYRGRAAAGTTLTADWSLTTVNDRSGRFGVSLAGARDLNGDGFVDLVAGSPSWDGGVGRAYVYYGASGGFPMLPSLILEAPRGPGFGGLLVRRDVLPPERWARVNRGGARAPPT